MNLAEIRDLIRAEAGLHGLDEYTVLIDSILNQELQQITAKSKYEELRSSITFPSVADATFEFDLPSDYQLFANLYFHDASNPDTAKQLISGIKGRSFADQWGTPRNYIIVGNKLQVYPYSNFYSGDFLVLEYYKRPILILDIDEFPIPSLEKSVQQLTMSRMLRMVDTKRAQMAKAEGNEAWMTSRGEHASNS